MKLPVLQSGWIALFFSVQGGGIVSTAPYFVFASKAICEEYTAQLAQTASEVWRIECRPGTPTGPSLK